MGGLGEAQRAALRLRLNIDMPGGEADIGKRVELGKASLKALGILP